MTPGFGHPMPNTTMRNIFFSFVYFVKDFHVLMPAYTAVGLPAPRVNWDF
jgi:hypothetical protein